MINTLFSQMELDPRILEAVEAMGFTEATPVQAQVIPLIRGGADVIAKSQTGTGKTAAFGIPTLEAIDTAEDKPTIQALILCPTRELAQQAGDEMRKLSKFLPSIRLAEVYGGASMDRQFIQLRRANITVGTPGRIMDHMRRGTIKLQNLKLIVLDEADEMLNMGFKEDIETILRDTPKERQTVLFSATMPPAIVTIARTFQKDPQTVEINKSQVTLAQIDQSCVETPISKKKEALELLLRYHKPNRALIFCNTKHMVDELGEYLNAHGLSAESIHGDMKQAQRSRVMNEFKRGRVEILIATDVAARGIDVNDLDYVFNYDIPANTEYYVHRIGRTGRAGKPGVSITLFSGKRQGMVLRNLSLAVKAEIRQDTLPTRAVIQAKEDDRAVESVATAVDAGPGSDYAAMVTQLVTRGYAPEDIAAAAIGLLFPPKALPEEIIVQPASREQRREGDRQPVRLLSGAFVDVMVDVGSISHVEPKHLVGAITEHSGLSGREVGKIRIYPEYSLVGVPTDRLGAVIESMVGCKICGKRTHTTPFAESEKRGHVAPIKVVKKVPVARPFVSKGSGVGVSEPARRKRKLPDFEG